MEILFVCAGNTCRSPMAEALLNCKLTERKVEGVQCASAGTHVWPGDKAAFDTVEELKSRGIDIEGRAARQLNAEDVAKADAILTMTEGVSMAVLALFSQAEGKVFTLGEYVDEPGDVDDPYGCDEEVYHATADQIDGLLEKLLKKIG